MLKKEKRLIRNVVRTVHPDLFSAYPIERQKNSESLKKLNGYLDDIAHGKVIEKTSLEFWVKENDSLREVHVELGRDGNLSTLFHAFGLLTTEELKLWKKNEKNNDVYGADLLDWLKTAIDEAVKAADEHYALKANISKLKLMIEETFGIIDIKLGEEYRMISKDQIESLKKLYSALLVLRNEKRIYTGTTLCLHHEDYNKINKNMTNEIKMKMNHDSVYISDDGVIHVIADQDKILKGLRYVQVDRARLLSRIKLFWIKRAHELTQALKQLLKVEDILYDMTLTENVQKYVLWAGNILEYKKEIKEKLLDDEKIFNFSILVHSDPMSKTMIEYLAASSILQIKSECNPELLLEFLLSETCLSASEEAKDVQDDDDREEELLENVRDALGARQVIRVCSIYEREQVMGAAKRLIENASKIRRYVDLSNTGIAIDNSYQTWESGFISIPYNFQIKDLQSKLDKILLSENTTTEDTVFEDTVFENTIFENTTSENTTFENTTSENTIFEDTTSISSNVTNNNSSSSDKPLNEDKVSYVEKSDYILYSFDPENSRKKHNAISFRNHLKSYHHYHNLLHREYFLKSNYRFNMKRRYHVKKFNIGFMTRIVFNNLLLI